MYIHLQRYSKSFKVGLQFFLDLDTKTAVQVHLKVSPVLIVTDCPHRGTCWITSLPPPFSCIEVFRGWKRASRKEYKHKYLAFSLVCSQGGVRVGIWTLMLFDLWHIIPNILSLCLLCKSSVIFWAVRHGMQICNYFTKQVTKTRKGKRLIGPYSKAFGSHFCLFPVFFILISWNFMMLFSYVFSTFIAWDYLYVIIELFMCPWLLFFSCLKCTLIPLFEKKRSMHNNL